MYHNNHIENIPKYYFFLITVAAVNCLSGPISVFSPLALGLMNLYFPFTDEKLHKTETEDQE